MRFLLVFGIPFLLSCFSRQPPSASTQLSQRAYLWQRSWTPAVADSLSKCRGTLDGVVILGAEIGFNTPQPSIIRATVDWPAVKRSSIQVSLAVRIHPFGGPFSSSDQRSTFLCNAVRHLADEEQKNGITLREVQIDFDCAQSKLAGYKLWLQALRMSLPDSRLVITTLPAWLSEPVFPELVTQVDAYVLQVHSVPTFDLNNRVDLCDPKLAEKWVETAARLGRPFSIALPTYRCFVGYDSNGKLLGMAFDGVQPSWPPGTRVREFCTDPDEIATLVLKWKTHLPPASEGLLWYRLPVGVDERNWSWPTFSAVMEGRRPRHDLVAECSGSIPTDVILVNNGEAEETLDRAVTVTWKSGTLAASDALQGWILEAQHHRCVFRPEDGIRPLRLLPGNRHVIGWLRYEESSASPVAEVSR